VGVGQRARGSIAIHDERRHFSSAAPCEGNALSRQALTALIEESGGELGAAEVHHDEGHRLSWLQGVPQSWSHDDTAVFWLPPAKAATGLYGRDACAGAGE